MPETTRPVLIDLGKVKRKHAKQLKNGEGPLTADVSDAVQMAVAELGDLPAGAVIVPVVVLCERKPKSQKALFPLPFALTR